MATQIRQGDQYYVPFYLTRKVGDNIVIIDNDPNVLSNMSITIGTLTKRYDGGQGELSYDSVNHAWLFPLTQTETMSLKEGRYEVEVRAKWVAAAGTIPQIESGGLQPIEIIKAIDRRAL